MDNDQSVQNAEALSCIQPFDIILDDDAYYLIVQPPSEMTAGAKEPEVLTAIREKNIKNVDMSAVIRTIREANGIRTKIAPPPEPEAEPDISVLVARDRMEATLQIDVPKNNCRKLSIEEVYHKIRQSGVLFGVDQAQVELAYSRPGNRFVIARGKPPIDGQNAYIKYHIELENKGRPIELEDGSVDFKNLNLFTTVYAEDVLAEKIPATLGVTGMDVIGQTVPAKAGKDISLPLGKNVKTNDHIKVLAASAGHFVIANNKINVIPVIEVKEDVDLSTGNIEFVGNVVVRGSVQNGFTVKAEGNVEVMGNVSGGIVEGKNIVVRMGIQGMNTGYIKAQENVSAKFIENATVYAGGDIQVLDVVLHSMLNAGKRVLVEGRRGQITGGKVLAGEEIRAKTVGTQRSPNTDLEVGVNPLLREEYLSLRKEIRKVEFSYEQTLKGLTVLRSMDQSSMTSEKREMLLKLTKAQFQLAGQIEQMRNRIMEIELALEDMKAGRIRIADTVYPGTKVVIGSLVKPIREVTRFVSYYADEGEIKTGPYK